MVMTILFPVATNQPVCEASTRPGRQTNRIPRIPRIRPIYTHLRNPLNRLSVHATWYRIRRLRYQEAGQRVSEKDAFADLRYLVPLSGVYGARYPSTAWRGR